MIELEVTMRQFYNKKPYIIGDTLYVDTESEAADLVALRMAVRKKPAAPVVPPVARDMKPVDDETVEPQQPQQHRTQQPSSGKQNQTYNRRDMRPAR